MAKQKQKRVYTRQKDGETPEQLATRLTKLLIDAFNEDRASRGEPPLPKKSPKK
jgi:hypothetical protein